MARLRVGVIGCGTVAQIMWLPNLRQLNEHFDLKTICDLSPGLTETDLRDYFEELAFLGEESRVRIQFPSPFLRHSPTPVEVQGMENKADYHKRVQVSYAEAFKDFHECINAGREPLTHAGEGKDDIAFLQKVVAAANPEGLGGEASQ
jgi:predicted dehydrogenase